MRLAQLQAGDAEEQTLAVVLDRLQRLAQLTEQIDERLGRAESLSLRKKRVGRGRAPEPRDQFGRRLVTWDEYQEALAREAEPKPDSAADLKAEIEAEKREEEPRGPDGPELLG